MRYNIRLQQVLQKEKMPAPVLPHAPDESACFSCQNHIDLEKHGWTRGRRKEMEDSIQF